MPALLLSLLPLLGQFAPELAKLAFMGHAPAVADKVESVLQRVFGTTDPAQVQAAVAADPSKGADLAAQLAAETDALKASLGDVQSARAAQLHLVEVHSRMAWFPILLDSAVAFGFLATLYVMLLHPVELTVNQVALLNILFGVLTASFVQVMNFWRGTSSSAVKRGDQAIAAAYDATPGGR